MDRLLLLVGATQLAMILQQRQAEESLRQSEERLRLALAAAEDATRVKGDVITTVSNELRWTAAIVEHSNDAIIGRTLDGIITSWNPGATQLYEYSAEEMIGRPIGTLAPPERLHDPSDILKKITRGDTVHHYDTERVTKAGRRIDVSLTVSPIRDASGALIGASVVSRDISDRKRAERTLRALLEAAPDATVIVDAAGGIVMVNAQVEPLFGYARDELVGRPVGDVCAARPAPSAHRDHYVQAARVRPMGAGLELCALRKDGSEVPVENQPQSTPHGRGHLRRRRNSRCERAETQGMAAPRGE
jgi:PAS domain S-box-containing protein